jgi:hypothetical protein
MVCGITILNFEETVSESDSRTFREPWSTTRDLVLIFLVWGFERRLWRAVEVGNIWEKCDMKYQVNPTWTILSDSTRTLHESGNFG